MSTLVRTQLSDGKVGVEGVQEWCGYFFIYTHTCVCYVYG